MVISTRCDFVGDSAGTVVEVQRRRSAAGVSILHRYVIHYADRPASGRGEE